jgi:hypothetical protein
MLSRQNELSVCFALQHVVDVVDVVDVVADADDALVEDADRALAEPCLDTREGIVHTVHTVHTVLALPDHLL